MRTNDRYSVSTDHDEQYHERQQTFVLPQGVQWRRAIYQHEAYAAVVAVSKMLRSSRTAPLAKHPLRSMIFTVLSAPDLSRVWREESATARRFYEEERSYKELRCEVDDRQREVGPSSGSHQFDAAVGLDCSTQPRTAGVCVYAYVWVVVPF